MKIKNKIAVLLRRLAYKLDHERFGYGDGLNLPSRSQYGYSYYKIRRIEKAHSVSPHEEMRVHEYKLRGYQDADKRMRAEYYERIANSIVKGLMEKGIIEYEENRDPVMQTHIISGSLYVGIRLDKYNNIDHEH